MIDLILKMLELDEFRGISKDIDIVKGCNKLPATFKEGWRQRKRRKAWQ